MKATDIKQNSEIAECRTFESELNFRLEDTLKENILLNQKFEITHILQLVECVKYTFDIWFHVIYFRDTSKDIIYQNRVSPGCQTDKVRYINETHNENFTFRELILIS